MYKHFGKISESFFFLELNTNLPYDPEIPHLAYSRENKICLHIMTCTQMYMVPSFIKVITWKQLKCPSVDEWRKKFVYIYAMDYHLVIKRNKVKYG